METDFHSIKAVAVPNGYQAQCTCGWHRSVKDRMSDDYAWTNARDEGMRHFKEIERSRADSASEP